MLIRHMHGRQINQAEFVFPKQADFIVFLVWSIGHVRPIHVLKENILEKLN